MEGKKISFGFLKKKNVEKPMLPIVNDEKREYIECVEEKSIKVVGGEIETVNEPLVIPMQPNTLITAERLKQIAEKVESVVEEPETKAEPIITVIVPDENETLDQMAVRELMQEAKGQIKVQTPDPLAIPTPAKPVMSGEKESTLDDYEAVPVQQFGLAMLRGMGWTPGKDGVRTLSAEGGGSGGGGDNAAAIVESSYKSPGRGSPRKTRRGCGRGGQAGEARVKGGGVQNRPLARDNINIGMIEELPLGSPLETPLHVKRRRTLALDQDDYNHSDSWSTFLALTSTEVTIPAQPTAIPRLQPEPSGSTSLTTLQLKPHVECETTTKPRAARKAKPRRRPIRDDKIGSLLNYGSEEEEEQRGASDDEFVPHLPVPRSVRVLFEADEDTPQEAEDAGRVDTPVKCAEAAQIGSMVQGPTSLFDFDWKAFPTSPIAPHLRRETFVGSCGPTISPISSPYEAFVLIWDRPIMEQIVFQTNLYAQEYAKHLLERGEIGPSSRITQWKDTDVDELYVYFAMLMAMGIVIKSKLEDYWCIDRNIFSTPGFSVHMNLKRFQLLSRCLHFNNNENVSLNTLTRSQAKIYKVAPIVEHLNLKFSSLYNLGQNIALDESLTQWKGWLDIKQFIPHKAATVGIKTYEVCDSMTGYLWRFECHVGGQIEVEQVVIPGRIPNLVLRLLQGLERRGHTVWMDNYYNSPALARILKSLGYDCVGTLRTSHQFVPKQIMNLRKDDMRVGQVCGCTSGDVDLMVWRDQNRVAILSTYHGIAVSENKPILIKDYNICMGGVDKKDQMVSAYPMERTRTQIWYKKFFRRLLNVSVFNAYVLYKHTHKTKHRDFRMGLVTEILRKHKQSEPNIAVKKVRGIPKFTAEFIAHLPVELAVLPGGERVGKQRRKCVVCTKRTHYLCRTCNVALCVNFSDSNSSCYIKYHT